MHMKIELSYLAALLLSASRMVFRMQIYGIEQALLSATVEYGIDRAKRIPAYWLNGYTRIARGRGLGCSFLGR
jgi:hypothetical protein